MKIAARFVATVPIGSLTLSLLLSGCGGTVDVEVAHEAPSANEASSNVSAKAVPMNARITRLDDTFVGPAYDSDQVAVAALRAAVLDADQTRMQHVWSRMQPGQKLQADQVIRASIADLEDDNEDVFEAYKLMNRVDWASVHVQNEVLKATAGLAFGELRGRVVDSETNEPIEGMTIQANHSEHGMGPETFASKMQATTDKDGRFELTHVPVGEIVMIGLKPSHTVQASAEILAEQAVEHTFQAKALPGVRAD